MLLLSRAGIRDRANGFQSYWDYRTKGLLLHTHIYPVTHKKGFYSGRGWEELSPPLLHKPLCRQEYGGLIQDTYISLCTADWGELVAALRGITSPLHPAVQHQSPLPPLLLQEALQSWRISHTSTGTSPGKGTNIQTLCLMCLIHSCVLRGAQRPHVTPGAAG